MNIKNIYPIFLASTFVHLYNYLCCYTPCEVYTVLLIIIIITYSKTHDHTAGQSGELAFVNGKLEFVAMERNI